MKNLLCLILLFFTLNAFAQKFTIVQINAKWNSANTVKIPNISGVSTQFAYLEDQPESVKNKIKVVPVVVLYKNSTPVRQWNADLSFKLNITEEEILKALFESTK